MVADIKWVVYNVGVWSVCVVKLWSGGFMNGKTGFACCNKTFIPLFQVSFLMYYKVLSLTYSLKLSEVNKKLQQAELDELTWYLQVASFLVPN